QPIGAYHVTLTPGPSRTSSDAPRDEAFTVFFDPEDGIPDGHVTVVKTCALPICRPLILPAAIEEPAGQYERPAATVVGHVAVEAPVASVAGSVGAVVESAVPAAGAAGRSVEPDTPTAESVEQCAPWG